ncbi:MAG: hypothetical protein NZ529_00810 [Cytophagaceae bacterium]|nr:hypothetical protein [Cytophagaceae bacterium]MDW8455305.1 hypothetical protein [Cytophagaceae bacterium]
MKRLLSFFSRKKPQHKSGTNSHLHTYRLKGYTEEEMFGKEDVKEIIDDFEKAVKYLSVRIYNKDYILSFKHDELVYRKDLEGTVTVLVLDLPHSVESLLRMNVEKWSKNDDELFAIAIQNVAEKYKREVEKTDQIFYTLTGDDVFITSSVFHLSSYPALMGKYGAIFCIPTRHILLVCPISSDLDAEVCLQLMIPLADKKTEEDAENAITNNLFWHYNGTNELIYTYYLPNRLKYVLPPDLEEMIY